jgi:hypothetical protein
MKVANEQLVKIGIPIVSTGYLAALKIAQMAIIFAAITFVYILIVSLSDTPCKRCPFV